MAYTPVPYAAASDVTVYSLPAAAIVGVPNSTLTAIILANSAEMDTFFRSRWPVPFVSWGPDVTRAACMMSAPDILRVRGWNPEGPRDAYAEGRKNAMEWLKQIADGRATLDVQPAVGGPVALPFELLMSTDSLRGW